MKNIIVATSILVFTLVVLLGYGLYEIGFFNEIKVTKEITLSEIPVSLNIQSDPTIPDWDIVKVEEYNDNFTSPTCTVYFANDIELRLSKSKILYSGMSETQVNLENNHIKIFTDNNSKVYQYKKDSLYYSYELKKGENGIIIEQYIKTLRI